MRRHFMLTALAGTTLAAGGCAGHSAPGTGGAQGAATVQPGAPGGAGRAFGTADLAASTAALHTQADVRFMQGMIPHHAQALEMVALAPSRASSEAVRAMALRMEISQRDEIAFIERWLRSRGEALPETHAGMAMPMMPGMLTPEQMQRLRGATAREFDQLFLESMIQHHEGAVTMVRSLFATSGAGQESEIFQFASEVETDQRIEIDRMGTVLQQWRAR